MTNKILRIYTLNVRCNSLPDLRTGANALEKHTYSGLAAQKAAHAMFERKVAELQRQDQRISASTVIEMNEFLKNWLIDHIKKTDKLYAQYFKDCGVL